MWEDFGSHEHMFAKSSDGPTARGPLARRGDFGPAESDFGLPGILGVVQVVSLVIAGYGAVVASYLGYLTYRRERHRIRLHFRFEKIEDKPPGLAVFVANVGLRAVTIRDGWFFWKGEQGGIGPAFWQTGELPARVEDGDELKLYIEIQWVVDDPTPDGFAVEDATGRVHSQLFTADFPEQLTLFRQLFPRAL
jgi:hypothetical protein